MNNAFEGIFVQGCSHINRPCCEGARQGHIGVSTNPRKTAVQFDFFWRSVIIVIDQITVFDSNASSFYFYFHFLHTYVFDAVEGKCHKRITTELVLLSANDKLVG